METLKNKKYLGIAGAALLFISVFMAFIKIDYNGISDNADPFIKSWGGWILLLMSVASVMIMFRKELDEKLPQIYNTSFGSNVKSWGEKGLFIPIGGSSIILVLFLINKRIFYKIPTYTFIDIDKYVKISSGFWFALIGVALLIAHAVIYKGEEGTQTPQFNNPQQPFQPQQPVAPTTNTFTQDAYQQPTVPNTNNDTQNTNNQF